MIFTRSPIPKFIFSSIYSTRVPHCLYKPGRSHRQHIPGHHIRDIRIVYSALNNFSEPGQPSRLPGRQTPQHTHVDPCKGCLLLYTPRRRWFSLSLEDATQMPYKFIEFVWHFAIHYSISLLP
jgi:hypothetical protein